MLRVGRIDQSVPLFSVPSTATIFHQKLPIPMGVESGKSFWLVSARSSKGMCRGSPRTPPGRSKTPAPRTALPTSEACIFDARRGMISNSESQTRSRDPEGHPVAHRFTIGVEEEFQIIDPATCELRSHVSQLVSAASPDIAEQVKHEL